MDSWTQFLAGVAEELRSTMVVTRTAQQCGLAIPSEWKHLASRGQWAADAVMAKMQAEAAECGMSFSVITLPDGQEVCRFLGPLGDEKIAEIIAEATKVIDYAIEFERKRQGANLWVT